MQFDDIRSQRDYIQYSKEVQGYSRAIGKLLDLYVGYIPEVEKAYREKKTDAVFCGAIYASSWEAPLLYSLNTVPVSFGELGRLSDWKDMQIAEDYYQFPAETCSMVKCVVGQWHLRQNKSGIKRILGISSACEPFNMSWETMRKEGYDVHNIDVIYRAYGVEGERLEQLVDFFIEQIYGTVEWLTGSRKIDKEKLSLEIKRKNRLMAKVRRILDLRLTDPFYVRSITTILLLNIGLANYFGNPEEYEEALDLLIEEMENRPVNEEDQKRAIPLIWAGSTAQEFGIYEAVDQAGGALLGFRSTPFKSLREDIDPVEALARYVYANQRAGAEIYMRKFIDTEVARIDARGLILYGYIGCSYASVEKEMLRNYFHHKDLPSINLEGSFQIGAPAGQLLTRVKAFIEMLS